MNTGIKKEPAFDVQQAIRKIASRLEARFNDSEEKAKMSIPVQSEQDDSLMTETMPTDMRGGLTQTFNQKYGNQFTLDSREEDPLEQWEKNLENGDYVILGDKYDDGIVLPRKEFMDRQAIGIYGKERYELRNLMWNRDYNSQSVNTTLNDREEKVYIYPNVVIKEVELPNGEIMRYKTATEESVLTSGEITPRAIATLTSVQGSNPNNGIYYINNGTVKDYGYHNGETYFGENYSGHDIYAYFESIIEVFVEDAKRDLGGLALNIVAIMQVFWKLKGMEKYLAETALLTLGICSVARKTQIGWDSEKERVLSQYPPTPEWEEKRKEIRAQKVAEIFMGEAMAYFTQEWAGRMIENMKESKKWGLVVSFGVEQFFDYLRRDEPIVTMEDIKEWAEYIKANLLSQDYLPWNVLKGR